MRTVTNDALAYVRTIDLSIRPDKTRPTRLFVVRTPCFSLLRPRLSLSEENKGKKTARRKDARAAISRCWVTRAISASPTARQYFKPGERQRQQNIRPIMGHAIDCRTARNRLACSRMRDTCARRPCNEGRDSICEYLILVGRVPALQRTYCQMIGRVNCKRTARPLFQHDIRAVSRYENLARQIKTSDRLSAGSSSLVPRTDAHDSLGTRLRRQKITIYDQDGTFSSALVALSAKKALILPSLKSSNRPRLECERSTRRAGRTELERAGVVRRSAGRRLSPASGRARRRRLAERALACPGQALEHRAMEWRLRRTAHCTLLDSRRICHN